jgi:hypothetical protein
MDINEFSVACKLITMKLKGFEIPPVLTPALKSVLAGTGTTTPVAIHSPTVQMRPSLPQATVLPGGQVQVSGYGVTSPVGAIMPPTTLVLGNQVYQQQGRSWIGGSKLIHMFCCLTLARIRT